MTIYRLGASGEEVRHIQQRLAALEFYRGLIDGSFGGGTQAAVRGFQRHAGLAVDGAVAGATWKALFGTELPVPSLLLKPLDFRCLALTGAFETDSGFPDCFAGLSGNFDGQGISFGACQWNFGQESLQPLLKDMIKRQPGGVEAIFGEHFAKLVAALAADKRELMNFAAGIQHPVKHTLLEPWRGMFKSLGRTDEFHAIELEYAGALYQAALELCTEYGLWSQRGQALMFDIKVQNGGISHKTRARILANFTGLAANLPGERMELERMKIIANRRAEAAKPRWVEDVRARKLCIASGTGEVHGIPYDLEAQFGIALR
jgi:hypothetical protein